VIKHLTQAKIIVLGSDKEKAVSSLLQQPQPIKEVSVISENRPNTTGGKVLPSRNAVLTEARNTVNKQPSELEKRMARIKDVIDTNKERLERIFVYYCSFGEPLNTNKLRGTKFIKLLKDAFLLDQSGAIGDNNKSTISSKTPYPRPLRQNLIPSERGGN
jgi:hypothetical protein